MNDYYRWRASGMAPKIKAIFKIPGVYRFVPKFFFNMTQKSFGPQMGFRSEDKYLAKDEMRFNMVKCPYNDKCTQYGCPEIVCNLRHPAATDAMTSGHPAVITATLLRGAF